MNIREAKEEIIRSMRAYIAKDERGFYRIPPVYQRPLLLMGPPGIGKTAIMEQAAKTCHVGLLSYTITHHTRQSAVGLPQLVERTFEGRHYTVTEYTLSEIVGSIYAYMERTGLREGILFIDEINCVSETLAPTMLQFLQYKTFGNHKVPEGWMIVAAGNPPEFNRSVRELDMASLDRVRLIEVEADFSVWRDYAEEKGVHPAILSYLEIKPDHFYKLIQTREKREFVTARGWEDLSVLMREYERQGMQVARPFVEEFIRNPKIAGDFSSYYKMYQATAGQYSIAKLCSGNINEEEQSKLKEQLKNASADVRCMFIRHLLAAVSEQITDFGTYFRYMERKKEVLGQLLHFIKEKDNNREFSNLRVFFEQRTHALQVKKDHDLLKPWEEALEKQVDENLQTLLYGEQKDIFLKELECCQKVRAEELPSSGLLLEEENLSKKKNALLAKLNQLTDFIIDIFGEDIELFDWLRGLKNHGDFSKLGFERPEFADFLEQRRQEEQLQKKIAEMEEFYETDNRI